MKRTATLLIAVIMAAATLTTNTIAQEKSAAFPAYGTGPIEVRLYTDYFCPPCRAMKPKVESLLKGLVSANKIHLILVDTPISRESIFYAKEFLRGLQTYQNNLSNALLLKDHLNLAAAAGTTGQNIPSYLTLASVQQQPSLDVSTALARYNTLIKQDQVRSTPTCVIIGKNGNKKTYSGTQKVVDALQAIR